MNHYLRSISMIVATTSNTSHCIKIYKNRNTNETGTGVYCDEIYLESKLWLIHKCCMQSRVLATATGGCFWQYRSICCSSFNWKIMPWCAQVFCNFGTVEMWTSSLAAIAMLQWEAYFEKDASKNWHQEIFLTNLLPFCPTLDSVKITPPPCPFLGTTRKAFPCFLNVLPFKVCKTFFHLAWSFLACFCPFMCSESNLRSVALPWRPPPTRPFMLTPLNASPQEMAASDACGATSGACGTGTKAPSMSSSATKSSRSHMIGVWTPTTNWLHLHAESCQTTSSKPMNRWPGTPTNAKQILLLIKKLPKIVLNPGLLRYYLRFLVVSGRCWFDSCVFNRVPINCISWILILLLLVSSRLICNI